MALPRLIGLTGAAGAGKDTVADWMYVVYRAHRYSFATPIKAMTVALLQAAGTPLYDCKKIVVDPVRKNEPLPQLNGLTPRRIMQTLGTEWGRETLGAGVWMTMLGRRLEKNLAARNFRLPMVVTDVRFPNEAEMIRLLGGTVIRVVRPTSITDQTDAAHISETQDFPVDITIENDGTISDLNRKLLKLFPVTVKLP